MSYTIQDIATAVGATAVGDVSVTITKASEPGTAGPDDLALAMSVKYGDALVGCRARAAILWQDADWQAYGLKAAILVARPRMAMAGLTQILDAGQGFAAGIHPSAVIDPTAILGDNVSVGPLCVISAGAWIGAGSVIGPHCMIGVNVTLGAGAFLREMVSIGARVTIGDRFVCQPGARIGSDGFSFVTPEVSGAENVRKTLGDQDGAEAQSYVRIHSLGSVEIGDDVEIGANCTIDNGTIRNTSIGHGTKFDNQVHIGHNVRVGNDTLLCGQTGVSGSVDIGNNVVMGGQCGVADNVFVGDGVIAAGATKILSNVPAGRVIMGYPAVKMQTHTEMYKAGRRLPRLMRDVEALRKTVSKLDSND